MLYEEFADWTMPRQEDWLRLYQIRHKVFLCIQKLLEVDGHCKSYEGCFEVSLPNYFEEAGRRMGKDDSPPNSHRDDWAVTLHCYLIGPGRHHTWTGPSLSETLDRAEPEILKWIADSTADY
jgi:hypothetical protein